MGWSVPYGYVWAEGGGLRKAEESEMYNPSTSPPNQVGTPPPKQEFLDDEENIYKDEGGVIRNLRQGTPSGVAANDPRRYAPSPYSSNSPTQQMGPQASYGGGGSSGSGSSFSGSSFTGTFNSGGGYGATIPGGSTGSIASHLPNLKGGGLTDYRANPMASTQQGIDIANLNSGQMTGAANALMGVNPQVGQMERTLYDRYSQMLTDPNAFMENPVVKAALAKAQQAAGRSLAAGRMSRSGNAAQAISEATGQTLLGQYGQMADTLRQGAGMEASRWGAQTSAGLDAARIRAGALGAAGQVYGGAGQLGLQAGQAAAASADTAQNEQMRLAQFIAQMTGSSAAGLQAGGYGQTVTTQQYDPSRTMGYAGFGTYAPVIGASPNYTTSSFNLGSQYGGTSIGRLW